MKFDLIYFKIIFITYDINFTIKIIMNTLTKNKRFFL